MCFHSGNDMMVFLMMSAHSSSCSSVSVRGGARRMMLPCVGLASSPFSSQAHADVPGGRSTGPPSPRWH